MPYYVISYILCYNKCVLFVINIVHHSPSGDRKLYILMLYACFVNIEKAFDKSV